MTAAVRILMVSDSTDDVALLVKELERGGYQPICRRVDSRETLIDALTDGRWDAILSDFQWNGFGALSALAIMKERDLDIPFLIVSDTMGEETAVRAIKAGAHNCIPKNSLGRLAPTLERELRESQIRHERHLAQKAVRESEARFRTLAETASDVILTVNPAGQILFANRAAERVFGVPIPALIGEPLTRLLPEFPVDRLGVNDADFPHSSLRAPVALDGRRADGSAISLEISLGGFVKSGRPLVTVIARDVAERKKAELALRESEERLRTLVQSAPLVLFAIDNQGRFEHVEGKGLEVAGFKPEDIVGRTIVDIYPQHPHVIETVRRALLGESFTAVVPIDQVIWEVRFNSRRDEQGEPIGAVGVAIDVTEQQRARRAADRSETRYRHLFERNLAGVFRTTVDGRILDCNESFARIFGYESRQEALEHPAWDFYLTAEDRNRALVRLQENQTLSNYEHCLRRRDGTLVWVLENGSLVEGPDGEATIIEGTLIDITERKRAEEQVKHLAFHDTLTGLPNRLLFNDRLHLAILQARRRQQRLATLFLDLDRFKLINDSLGHSVGDELLRRVAERVIGCVREGDTVARLGGDEFTVLVPGISQDEDAAKIAQKILEVVRAPFEIGGREFFLTTSIGVAIYPSDGHDLENLLRNADTAMYRAKERGRDTYQLYTASMNSKALERLSLESRLRQALVNDELVIYYQPLLDLRTGRIRGAEALLRWQHPGLGLLPPAEFISLAELSGLIVPIGQWVLRSACAQVRRWQEMGFGQMSVAVNLSARQFQQADLVRHVTDALEQAKIPAASLDLEITESNAMQNAEVSISTLQDLKGLGIRLSMDDFGTGYSSLNYLKRFPIDRIKIDQSFVRDVPHDADDAAIAAAVIAMAHRLELTVVAEGVETEDQLAFLRQNQCDEMQGYLYSAPVSAEEFEKLLRANRRLSRPSRPSRPKVAR
jgi:diguanylate cyclase (GGDEF)-like protein/PAS domain S-box-containing protein